MPWGIIQYTGWLKMATVSISQKTNAGAYVEQRAMLAASFRWTARLNLHEGVANHFSLAVNESGTGLLVESEPASLFPGSSQRPVCC